MSEPVGVPPRHRPPFGWAMRLSPSVRVVTALGLGLAAGFAANARKNPALLALASLVEPVGTLWVNAILMTVVALVVSSLVVAVASAGDSRMVGRLGRRAIALFLLFSSCCAVLTALITPRLLARLPLDAAATATLMARSASAGQPPVAALSPRDFVVGLVPSNPIKAAADGALLPLVVFTLAFAVALTRVAEEPRRAVVRFFEGVASATRVLVAWVLGLAPLGVFALTFPLAARLGSTAAGALIYYLGIVALITMLLLIALYPAAALGGRLPVRRFARAVAPAQAVAFSSRSSLASLPALVDGAERVLGLPPAITGFCLPLAVSTFKISSPGTILVGLLFMGKLYGVAIPPVALAQATALSVLLSFAVPGVPGGWLLIAAPIFAAVGLPAGAIGTLLAIDTIPDMLRTPVNVTADLVVAALLSRPTGPALPPPSVPAEYTVQW